MTEILFTRTEHRHGEGREETNLSRKQSAMGKNENGSFEEWPSLRSRAADDRRHRKQQNLEIEPERPIVDVLEVEPNPIFEIAHFGQLAREGREALSNFKLAARVRRTQNRRHYE